MKGFLKIFDSELDHLLDPDNYIDCRLSPDRLLRELKSSSQVKKLIKHMDNHSTNPYKYMKILSVCNLLLMYNKDWYNLIQSHLKLKTTKDQWLNLKFIEPYHMFLIRCCTSQEQYNAAKGGFCRKGEALEGLFYAINMLKMLFKIVEKMPFLGRYYKPAHSAVISSAVQILALQAQKLYGFFKGCLNEILYRRQIYIKSKDDERILQGIFGDQLTIINEEMKKLFLDKYFYPLGRGIGVKLFRPEEQSAEFQKTINSIVNNHQETERVRQQKELEDTLFPGSGLVNWNFYEQTLLGNPMSAVLDSDSSTFKGLDELVLSDQDEEIQQAKEIPLKFLKEKVKEKEKEKEKEKQSDKDTNTGTIQKKGNEM